MPPEPFDAPTDELLFRFIADRCSASERGEVEGWLRRDPANAHRFDDVRRIWQASRPAPLRDVDRMWTRLRAAAEDETMQRSGEPSGTPGTDRARPALRAASLRWPTRTFPAATWAAAVVVLAASAALFFSFSRASAPARTAVPPRVYATGRGQTANVRLADGTRVTLAPQTRLTVPDDFGGAERSVTIEGQALFDVVHDATHPFRVSARGAAAEDIGTRFEMSAYADEPAVSVIVAEGAVTFGHVAADARPEGVVVTPGQRATAGAGNTITVDRVPLSLVGWTDGHLAFVKTPLAEIARTIGRWYDLDVQIADATLQRRLVTADFDTQSPKEMIAALATAVGAQVERHGRALVIRPAP